MTTVTRSVRIHGQLAPHRATPRAPRMSVQICSYNRHESLARCLESLFNLESPSEEFEIVLVDDGSTDPTPQMVAALSPPCAFRYVRQAHAGLASARNAGIRAAAGEIVLFLDDDVIAAPSLVEEHWRAHQQYGLRSIVVGRVRHITGLEVPPRTRPRLADFSTSFFWTCNASVRRADLYAAGLFDETFTEYGWEDLEFGGRLRQLGLRRRRSRGALVYHVKPPPRGSDLARLVDQAEASGRSAVVYLRKAPSWRARLTTGLSPARVRINLWAARLEPLWWRLAHRAGPGELRGVARSAAWLLQRARYYRAAVGVCGPAAESARAAPPPHRVLIVRADGLGDTILTMPLLRALRSRPGPMEICVLVSTPAAGVLQRVPEVDRLIQIDVARASLIRRLALARQLRRERFDVTICVSEKWWPHVWTRASRAPVRVGVDPGATQPIKRLFLPAFLTHRVPLAADPFRASPLHEVERYLALLTPLGIAAAPARLSLPLPESQVATARQRVRSALGSAVTPVAVQLSRKWSTEGWRDSTVAEVCLDMLARRADIGLVILGGAEETALATLVTNRLRGGGDGRVLLARPGEFAEWASLLSVCRALVTMDTAAAHLAAALDVPVVDVFEACRFEHVVSRWAPWQVAARTLRRDPIPAGATEAERTVHEAALCRDVIGALGELL